MGTTIELLVLDGYYSVMQSDRNSFCGDVVFNMEFRDEERIWGQKYGK